jgi:arabinogalactan oligomer/maltooligosaccharide transport system permease protein
MSDNSTEQVKIKEPSIFVRFGHGFVNFFTKSIPNFFTKKLPNFFVNLFKNIKKGCINLVRRFTEGSVGTKLSHLIFGAGNLYRGQIIKGLIYLACQVGLILLFVLCPEIKGPNNVMVPLGYKAIQNLVLEGHEVIIDPLDPTNPIPASSSQLMLLFGLVTIGIMILYVILWNSSIKSSVLADKDVKEGRKPTSFKQDLQALLDGRFHILMITPTFVAATVFTILPTLFMICIAFTTYNDLDMSSQGTALFHWNGLNNFGAIFSGEGTLGREIHDRFFPVLGWTIIWAIFATFTCYFGGILLALLINKKGLKGKKVFRTMFVLTIAIPQFISLLAMRFLLSADGPVNNMLKEWGWISQSISFLGLETTGNNVLLAKTMIIVINMWLGIPYTMLMTSGILLNIPADLYEAARVDGTSKTKMFFKITMPYIIFITTPYLISSFIGNINSFNTIFLLSGGGPTVTDAIGGAYKAGETDLLVTWLYKLTIDNGDYNTGAVIGILTFLFTSIITLITYRNSKAYKEEDTFQ